VVAADEHEMPVQQALVVFSAGQRTLAFLSAFRVPEAEIPQEVNRVVRLDALIVPFDNDRVHMVDVFEGALAIANYITMAEKW
jgi:hypothetical protein